MGEGEAPLLHWLSGAEDSHPGLLRNGFNDQPCHWYAPDVDALPDWDRELFHFVSNDGNRYEQAVPIAFSRGFVPSHAHSAAWMAIEDFTNNRNARHHVCGV